MTINGETYTVVILVQSNYGATKDLMIDGQPIDETVLVQINAAECDKGSIIVVLACASQVKDLAGNTIHSLAEYLNEKLGNPIE